MCGDRVGYLHIGESPRDMLGTGNVNFGRIFKALKEANYTGPIVFDPFSKDIKSAGVVETLAVWRNMWPIENVEEVAKSARVFIAGWMEMMQQGTDGDHA